MGARVIEELAENIRKHLPVSGAIVKRRSISVQACHINTTNAISMTSPNTFMIISKFPKAYNLLYIIYVHVHTANPARAERGWYTVNIIRDIHKLHIVNYVLGFKPHNYKCMQNIHISSSTYISGATYVYHFTCICIYIYTHRVLQVIEANYELFLAFATAFGKKAPSVALKQL